MNNPQKKLLCPIDKTQQLGYFTNMTTNQAQTKTELSAVKATRYLVTKQFTGGYMKGLTIVDESPVPFYVGFKTAKPYLGSPYIVTKTEQKN